MLSLARASQHPHLDLDLPSLFTCPCRCLAFPPLVSARWTEKSCSNGPSGYSSCWISDSRKSPRGRPSRQPSLRTTGASGELGRLAGLLLRVSEGVGCGCRL